MSRRGNPYDNAFAESFMKTLKRDKVSLWDYETFDDYAGDLLADGRNGYHAFYRNNGVGFRCVWDVPK